ncbi:MAG: AraC family transcriptional regulator [Lachnospiraceae bacterium]
MMELDNFNPTFLFTWKGKRDEDEKRYHSHDFLEIAFMMSGSGYYRIDGSIVPVEEGDVLILNPGVMHQGLLKDKQTAVTEFFVGISDFHIKGMPENQFPLPEGSPIVHATGELQTKLFKLCASMEAENSVCWEGRYYMMKAYMMQMVLLLLKSQMKPREIKTGYAFESINRKYVVEQIVGYFEDHYAEKISLDTIAENMYLSPFYISKIFKSETGEAPIRHLINIRLQKALELLQQEGCSNIKEVACQVGYDDAYHFSKLFKKHFGFPPSEAKKQLQG